MQQRFAVDAEGAQRCASITEIPLHSTAHFDVGDGAIDWKMRSKGQQLADSPKTGAVWVGCLREAVHFLRPK
jgi:hypothetical protein